MEPSRNQDTQEIQLTLSPFEYDELQRFLHLSAMCLQTWPVVAGEIVAAKVDTLPYTR